VVPVLVAQPYNQALSFYAFYGHSLGKVSCVALMGRITRRLSLVIYLRDMPVFTIVLAHVMATKWYAYLCIKDSSGKTTCGGQDQCGKKWYDPINGPGKPSDDKYDSNTCELKELDNKCIEQCLLKKFAGPRPRYGIPFGTDCQEWSDEALKDCQTQCKKKS
jgi:hypothetical protein